MKRILWIVLAGLALGACHRERRLGPPKAVPVSADGRMDLKLMSFNVRYENPEDLGSRSWHDRVVGAVRMIRSESPDVIGVQEALHGQAADLWASLPDYEFFGVGRDDGKRAGEYAGIFYRRDRFEADPADHGTFWLSDTPEKPGSRTWGNVVTRVAAWIHLTDRSTGRSFYVFNTHWDHQNQPSREKAAELILQRIKGRRHPQQPAVLLGDFNATLGNPAVARLTRSGLTDVWSRLHSGDRDFTTLHFWAGNRGGRRKVDHILVSGDARVISAGIRDSDQPMVSDHFPVTAELEFP